VWSGERPGGCFVRSLLLPLPVRPGRLEGGLQMPSSERAGVVIIPSHGAISKAIIEIERYLALHGLVSASPFSSRSQSPSSSQSTYLHNGPGPSLLPGRLGRRTRSCPVRNHPSRIGNGLRTSGHCGAGSGSNAGWLAEPACRAWAGCPVLVQEHVIFSFPSLGS
jgi:hypothetical protein